MDSAPIVWERDAEFDGERVEVCADDRTVSLSQCEPDDHGAVMLFDFDEWDAIVAAVAKARTVYAVARKAVSA